MFKFYALLAAIGVCAGCGHKSADLGKLSDEFVYTSLAFSPSAATAAGLHQYNGKDLDDMLDDVGPQSLDRQHKFYESFGQRLATLNRNSLSPEEQADLTILQSQDALALLDLNEIHTVLHSPTGYVETLGTALFTPYVLEYAPQPARMRSIISRLQQTPLFLDQASSNLVSSPDIWTKVAIEENEGNIDLVDHTIRAAVPDDLRENYDRAARQALDAMQKFQDYLKNKLSTRDNADWRLGRALYIKKFRNTLESGIDVETMLANAEADLEKTRAHMLELALPLHHSMFPGRGDYGNLPPQQRQNMIIGEVLDRIAERHSTRESYLDDARKDLEEARAFVQEKHLLTLPGRANLQVIATPAFMRGIYSVGGFSPAPTLEPQLGAFYWVTPIPSGWPKERVESKLREYNFYKLKLLTIHEAMPGHYVQFEFADDLQPQSRRVLRSVYGNGAYIEGWGQYSEQMMLDEGFLDHSPELALTFAKERLRVLANAIIDVRLHTLNMTDQEALDLMQKETFQEAEEARGKLQRAKLSSCQLPTYYVGWQGWLNVRNAYKAAKGGSYKLAEFNDQALGQGAVPLAVLGRLLP